MNTDKRPVAIVLGGTNPHISLIENLKRRGYFTVLIDYYDNPPAKKFADYHVKESTLDQDRVLETARELEASLVISTAIDQANVTACYVGEKLGLPIPYSYQTALEVTNKGMMKRKMMGSGVSTSKYYHVTKASNISDLGLRFPVMVKPADSCASAGVKKSSDITNLKEHLDFALSISRAKEAIIEEFVTGKEYSIYAFIKDFKVEIIMISERHSVIDGSNEVLKCYATTTPVDIAEGALNKIKDNANKIAKAFNLNNTPLHVQVIVDKEEVHVIEFAPRVGGGMSYTTILSNTGFDIIDATIDSFLGNKVTPVYHPPQHYYTINIVYATPGVYHDVVNYESLVEEKIVEKISFYRASGTLVTDDKANGSRIAAFITKSNSMEESYQKTERIKQTIDVLDTKGQSIMRRDLFLSNDKASK
jgi:biotin carboxylase